MAQVPYVFGDALLITYPQNQLAYEIDANFAYIIAGGPLDYLNVIGNTTVATAAVDGGRVVVQNSATTAYSVYSPITVAPLTYWDNVRSTVVIPNGTTSYNTTAYGFYLIDNTPLTTFGGQTVGAGVGYWGIGIANVDNSAVWALATYLSDNSVNAALTTVGRGLQGHEYDFGIYGNGTTVTGASFLMGGLRQPVSSIALQVGADGTDTGTGLPIRWAEAFVSRNGASPVAFVAGATASSGTNVASQKMNFYGFDGASALYYATLSMFNHSFFMSDLTNVNGLEFDLSATGSAPMVRAAGTDTNIDLALSGQGTGVLKFGTHSAVAAETFSGFLTVKDAAGTSRKIMVCS